MKKLLAFAFCLAAVALTPARADSPLRSAPLGYCQLTVTSGAALNFTSCSNYAAILAAGPNNVLIVASASVTWRDDGTAPTATVGMPLAANTYWDYSGALFNIQFIGTATVNASFYR